MSDESKMIYAKIPLVMHSIGAIGKGRKNQAQNYFFRGIDDLYNAVQPAMVEHGIFVAPEVIDREMIERTTKSGAVLFYVTLTVKHHFYAADGSSVCATTVGEAFDSGDKATNKAMSAAMKYALLETFCIPTEGDNDTENHTHDVAPAAVPQRTTTRTTATKPAAPAAPQRPLADGVTGEVLDENTQADDAFSQQLEEALAENGWDTQLSDQLVAAVKRKKKISRVAQLTQAERDEFLALVAKGPQTMQNGKAKPELQPT